MTEGMDPGVIRAVLQDREIAYFVTDCALKIVESFGATEPLCARGGSCLGGYLPDWVPELLSCEETLRSILAGELPRFELNWVNRDRGEEQPLYLTMVTMPWCDANGKICGLLHVIQDITEVGIIDQQLSHQRNELSLLKAQLEQQNHVLAAANVELQHLADLKAQFVMMTAHELRTPLTAIRGYVEMLLDDDFGPLPAEPREALTLVSQSVSRLQMITEALMDATRIETGRVELLL
ncbi:MAG: histidine kinase dimerization/phospho-acceptor domain-containing protein, partial [Anaerolineae bacterium]|nr:histidine kinase dimerization/phospho-acceptor domain-containing protein [Anaerolineae bacterium]